MADPASGLTGQDLIDYTNGQRANPGSLCSHFRSYEILNLGSLFIPKINGHIMGGHFDSTYEALGQCAAFAAAAGSPILDDSMDLTPAPAGFSSTDPCLTYGTYDTTPLLTAGNGLYDTFGITGYSAEAYGFLITFTSEALSDSFHETYATFTANGVALVPGDWNEISTSKIYSTTANGIAARDAHRVAGAGGTGTMEWTL